MVGQNFILYVNQKNYLRQTPLNIIFNENDYTVKFTIAEKHLICGMVVDGKPVKGDYLQYFPFKPIEKHLFEFSNIHFVVPQMEFNQENTDYNFNLENLGDLAKRIFWGSAPAFQRGEGSPLFFSQNANNEFNQSNENIYFHLSFDGINFQKFDFWEYALSDVSNGYYLSFTISQQFMVDMGFDYDDSNGVDYYEQLPRYIYFTDSAGKKSTTFHIAVPA